MKHIATFLILITILAGSAGPVFAQPAGSGNISGTPSGSTAPVGAGSISGTQKTFALTNPLKGITSVGGLVNKFIEIVSYLLILFAVLMIIWTGLQMILARGNPAKLTEEGKRLGWILIGVALVIGARVIITVIINTLQASGTVDPRVIQSTQKALNDK
jgi:uncharacterized membrane protein